MKTPAKLLILLMLIGLNGCSSDPVQKLQLPEAISNNASAKALVDKEIWFYSFNGLKSGKSWKEVSSAAFAVNPKSGESKRLQEVPGTAGRLASVAATVNNQIYIFGGYTVATDHSEVSTPEVYRFDPQTATYELVTHMPTPVDDSVALVYQNRYIYLISGWHNDGNVNLVQILDTQDMSWHQGTPYPGAAVFGQAAGIIQNKMVISDGVKVLKVVAGKRHYGISDDNYLGTIDPENFRKVYWQKLPMHPGPARYRMAATGSSKLGQIIFVGGSDNPYNFNGIGYNGVPSQPSELIFAYDIGLNQWQSLGKQQIPTMDHRALLEFDNDFYILGGMLKNQQTTSGVFKIELN